MKIKHRSLLIKTTLILSLCSSIPAFAGDYNCNADSHEASCLRYQYRGFSHGIVSHYITARSALQSIFAQIRGSSSSNAVKLNCALYSETFPAARTAVANCSKALNEANEPIPEALETQLKSMHHRVKAWKKPFPTSHCSSKSVYNMLDLGDKKLGPWVTEEYKQESAPQNCAALPCDIVTNKEDK